MCSVCRSPSVDFGEAVILEQHLAKYYRCSACGFIQTETPYWLPEAYEEALQIFDVGIMQRNLATSRVASAVISLLFPSGEKFLDYGGGHGTFVRLMRDRGYNFVLQDRYAKNIHARGFEHLDGTQYDLVTAFELLEHLPNPIEEIEQIFAMSDNVLTTTLVLPDPPPIPPDWWYYAVRGGQHVSLYTPAALKEVAKHFGRHLYSTGFYHLFTRQPIGSTRFRLATGTRSSALVSRLRRRRSLIASDFEHLSGMPLA